MSAIERLAATDEIEAALETRLAGFARLQSSNAAPGDVADAAVALLESATMVGEPAWRRLMLDDQLADIERVLIEPESLLAGLEQELFAPVDLGLPERAVAMIEALGHREPAIARDAERLLHATGATSAAYRIERGRKTPRSARVSRPESRLAPRLTVAIAGGHPRLRAMIRRDLPSHRIRDIPSKHEATSQGRDVAAKIAGSDLAVVIVRQIAHSTSDQVVTAAEKQSVPVAFATTASIASVRREVERFAQERGGAK